MAGEERDARLILRAEDRASRTFDQVAASIKRVRQEIAEQSKAATEGTGDLDKMRRQLEELKAAGDDLIQGQSLIRQFQGIEEQVAKAEKRLESATAALAAYQAKVGDTPTANQQVQLGKKQGSVDNAQAALERQNQRLAETTQRLERAGIATDDLDKEFHRIAATAVETASAIAAVKNQIDELPAAQRRAAQAAEALADANALAAKQPVVENLSGEQFAFIQSLDTAKAKLAALVEIEKEQARSAAAAAAQEAKLAEAMRQTTMSLNAQFMREVIAEEQRLADLDAFRKSGTDAAEAAVKVERYAASVQQLGNDFQSFSASVRQALGGTQSGLQDIGQALAQIDAAAEVMDKPKAKINELQESAGKLSIAIATLDRTARQIDGLRLQQQAVQASEAAFNEAQAEVLRLAAAIQQAEAPSDALASELAQAERALDAAGKAMQRDRNAAVEMGEALRRAGVDTDNLEAEMVRFQNAANKAGKSAEGFSGKLRGRGGFLGLNAFEMQNLGYQVNDVFTQLESGTPIFQVLAQQGPQIIQLFQGLGSSLLRLSPLIAGVLVLLSPFIGAMVQASRAADALREANTLLAGSADQGNGALAKQYADASVSMQNLGVSAKDAKTALEEFHRRGLDPSGLASYTQALADASKGGADMAESSKLLAEAMSGGTKEVEALNDKFNILTPAEETQIAKMIESGQESEARRIVFEKFEQTAQRMADSANGPWGKAWDNLTSAFNNFTRAISNSAPFQTVGRWLDWLRDKIIGAIDDLSYFLNYASKRGLMGTLNDAGFFGGGAAARGGQASADAAAFANRRGRAPDSPFPASAQRDTLEGERAIRRLTQAQEEQQRSLKKLTRAQVEAQARAKALESGVGSPAQRQRQADIAAATALAKFDDDASKAADRAAKKRQTAANKAARAAETLANQRRAIEEQLARDLDGIDRKVAEGQTASIQDRRDAVLETYTGLFQKLEEARRKGVTRVGDQSLAEYEATVRAQIAILQNQAELKAREDQINETIKGRADAIKAIQDQLDRGDITPQAAMTAFEETISRTAPQVQQMTADALAFAKSLRGAVPDPRLEATIARLERLGQQNSGGGDRTLLKNLDLGVIGDAGKELEQMVQEREALVAAENQLVQLGLKTEQEAQANIEAAYGRTTPLIQAQIDKMKELLAVFKDDPAMQTFYDTWMAKLDAIGAKSQYVSARFTQMKQGIDQIITSNAVNAIDQIAQSFAKLALNQQGAVDTLRQIGAAFLQFIAQTISGIAKLILQMLILDAVQKVTGIPVGALLKFMNVASGGFHTGGLAGTSDRTFTRQVPSIAFANAPRYHGGGVAGFAPDEVPAVLKRNEEILDTTDPRHRFNLDGGGEEGGGGAQGGLRQVLVLDPSELANALAGPAGEKVVMTHIRRNKTTIDQMGK